MTSPTGPAPAGGTVRSTVSSREARERLLKRSRAVAAAASIGGFASLVAVLIGHPASATTKTSTSTATRPTTSSSDDDSSGAAGSSGSSSQGFGGWSSGGTTSVTPHTVTTAS